MLETHPDHKEILLVKDMANTAWPGLLAAQSFFLTANLDEELFQCLMRAYQNFTIVCGVLQLTTPRDAFLTSLCKGAVPPSVIAASLAENKATQGATPNAGAGDIPSVSLSDRNLACLKILLNIAQQLGGVLDDSWYLVLETLQLADFILFHKYARGPPQNSRRIGTHQNASSSAISLHASTNPPNTSTAIKSKRSTASSAGVTTLGSSVQASTSNSSITSQQSAIDNDLNVLATQIKKLFENSKYLDDAALQSFTKALCRLNTQTNGISLEDNASAGADSEKMEKGFKTTPLTALRGNKSDEKSFAIEKLRIVALLNMHRLVTHELSLIWDLIVLHLIATANCISVPQPIRMQACESLDEAVISSMNHASSNQNETNERIQLQLLISLNQLVNNPERHSTSTGNKGQYVEVRKMGLETLNKLLQTSGHSFTNGWNMIFEMIKSVVILSSFGECEEEEGGSVGVT
ncbi:12748_t:CDS:2, partial [Ambispora leptoticha]